MTSAAIPSLTLRLVELVIVFTVALIVASCAPKSSAPKVATIGITEITANLPMPSPQGAAKVAQLPSPYNSGNANTGRKLFAECIGCHSLDPNGSETNGPNLHGIFERRAAQNKAYPYSEALRSSNIVWDVRHLDHWIFNPHEALPGTTMAYIGVRNDAKRRDILAYLIAVTDDAEAHKD
jgi:cytochrome c